MAMKSILFVTLVTLLVTILAASSQAEAQTLPAKFEFDDHLADDQILVSVNVTGIANCLGNSTTDDGQVCMQRASVEVAIEDFVVEYATSKTYEFYMRQLVKIASITKIFKHKPNVPTEYRIALNITSTVANSIGNGVDTLLLTNLENLHGFTFEIPVPTICL